MTINPLTVCEKMLSNPHQIYQAMSKLQFSFTVLDKFLHDVQKPVAHPTVGDAKRASAAVDDIINNMPLIDELNVKGLRDLIKLGEKGKIPDMKCKVSEAVSDYQIIESYYKKKLNESELRSDSQASGRKSVNDNMTNSVTSPRPVDKEQKPHGDSFNGKESQKEDDKKKKIPFHHPVATDVDDNTRPTKVAEQFSSLYDCEWTDAFDAIVRTEGKTENIEKDIIVYLDDILRNVFTYCVRRVESLLENISLLLEQTMLDPVSSTKEKVVNPGVVYNAKFQKYARTCVKETAKLSVPALIKDFKETDLRPSLHKYKDVFNVNKYIDRCVEVCWLMNVLDPPMTLKWPSNDQNTEILLGNFRYYTKHGIQLDYVVWPALLYYENGTVVVKGVIQMK